MPPAARRRLRDALVIQPNLTVLLPFMASMACADDTGLFRRRDAADRFSVITMGKILIEDIGKVPGTGDIFGEIAFFATDGKRTATARAVGPVGLAWMDRETLMRVCVENPEVVMYLSRVSPLPSRIDRAARGWPPCRGVGAR